MYLPHVHTTAERWWGGANNVTPGTGGHEARERGGDGGAVRRTLFRSRRRPPRAVAADSTGRRGRRLCRLSSSGPPVTHTYTTYIITCVPLQSLSHRTYVISCEAKITNDHKNLRFHTYIVDNNGRAFTMDGTPLYVNFTTLSNSKIMPPDLVFMHNMSR